ncbi:MAG TPA: biotin/lipoyl-binding protein [Patescibacteria group bacterium]|nr:biotin/lipoyl-binding protein [Patescibacteria group bacterium]
MNLKQKSIRMGVVFLLLLFIGGLLLVFAGHDAVTMAAKKKEGILTAEQVKIAFENIGGRLVSEQVKESQEVKKGDVLMVLDSVDTDLAIERLQAQIAQVEAQINQQNGSIEIGHAKTSTNELQSYRQIEQQKMALDAARATYDNQQLTYNRKLKLMETGAISQSELDSARMALDVATANAGQQQRMLEKMLAGTDDAAKEQVLANGNASSIYLPEIDQQRRDLENSKFGVQVLMRQKQDLQVQLKEWQVKKERLTLRAPEDGKVLKIIAKSGEMVAGNAPVILLESKRFYYDVYLDEQQAARFKVGDEIAGTAVATKKNVRGTVRFIEAAPGFADLKMTREKGQSDLAAFQVRIYVEPENLLPGMTIEVNTNAFAKR